MTTQKCEAFKRGGGNILRRFVCVEELLEIFPKSERDDLQINIHFKY